MGLGRWLGELSDNLADKATKAKATKAEGLTVDLISAHDTTVMPILISLGILTTRTGPTMPQASASSSGRRGTDASSASSTTMNHRSFEVRERRWNCRRPTLFNCYPSLESQATRPLLGCPSLLAARDSHLTCLAGADGEYCSTGSACKSVGQNSKVGQGLVSRQERKRRRWRRARARARGLLL